ncbi:hypothetical protein J1N35_011926 [Gossypium stocksii]|uniref:Uncharacterized protein n=1 Tax=Gossypium stocksii TaxID=47602 RepID=A0A9D3W4E4_9ROSI|nr:hypothetical protein J1N35_011926 [Gossypium stocksii]
MSSEALHTIDTMNKRVIARYVSKVEDIVDTMIKRNIEQVFFDRLFIVNLDIMRQDGLYPIRNVPQLVKTAPMSTTDSCYYWSGRMNVDYVFIHSSFLPLNLRLLLRFGCSTVVMVLYKILWGTNTREGAIGYST